MTVHEHAQRVLSAGIDGEANADDLALATSHVERCVECQRAAGGFAKVVEATRRLLPGHVARLDPELAGDPARAAPGPGGRHLTGRRQRRLAASGPCRQAQSGAPIGRLRRCHR